MSYTSIGREDFCPVGTILAYIGSSTVDPSGWVIANGSLRTNGGSDRRYSGLRGLSIGSGTDGSYTPPNLQAMFLRGIGSQTVSSIEYTDSTYKAGVQHTILKHNHTGTAAAHTHDTSRTTETGSTGSSDNPRYGLVKIGSGPPGNFYTETTQNSDDYYPSVVQITGLIVKNATPTVDVSTDGYNNNNNYITDYTNSSSDTTETRPFNYGVVWIIKL
jgi:hypothetical protein